MSSPEALLIACTLDKAQQQEILSRASAALTRWNSWLEPFDTDQQTGHDPAYDDNFLLMREEINKLSGTDSGQLCILAKKCLCETAKDIRVVTWYLQARLHDEGDKGLAEGLLLLVAMLTRYGFACHPRRPLARKAALEFLNSHKVLDNLALWPEVERNSITMVVGAGVLLANLFDKWPANEKPSLAQFYEALENRIAGYGGLNSPTSQNSQIRAAELDYPQGNTRELRVVKSARDLLEQAKILARWLGKQPQGWLASHRLMKTVRWDSVEHIPALDSHSRTRLAPPKPEYRAQLKRLHRQKNWTELVDLVSQMFSEGVNHFWLDLQWYLWQGLIHAGSPWEQWSDSVIHDLRFLLQRLPGLERLVWNDGSPFADEVTQSWIIDKVNEAARLFQNPSIPLATGHIDDILSLETEAMEKGSTESPEAALAWLQGQAGAETPRQRWLIRLLMARVAEQYGVHDMALHLLGELAAWGSRLTLDDWEPTLVFEVFARRLRLLRIKASCSESEKVRLTPEIETLLTGLITLDPTRAMAHCG